MSRIPPKGTQGYRMYWKDRYNAEALENKAREWEALELSVLSEERRVWSRKVAKHLRAAATVAKAAHANTDYFKGNQT